MEEMSFTSYMNLTENVTPSKGWQVVLLDKFGCNRGIVALDSKEAAKAWLHENEDDQRKHFDIVGSAKIMYYKG